MYAGEVVESAPTDTLFDAPAHPYTAALMRSTPRLTGDRTIPEPIPGRPSSLAETTPGCPFAPRCTHALSRCDTGYPGPDGRPVRSACIRSSELADELSHRVHASKEAPRWR